MKKPMQNALLLPMMVALFIIGSLFTLSSTASAEQAPTAAKTTFQIAVAGKQVTVNRLGKGPLGVIFFGHSDSKKMNEDILASVKEFPGLLPDKCSYFLWEYPESAPFDQVKNAIYAYLRGDKEKVRPDFSKIASSVVQQIQKKTGIKGLLLVGNSLGAGVILWDYKSLAADPKTKFLLISPTEAFMPPISTIGDLQRTQVLAATGVPSQDPFLQGEDASIWVRRHISEELLKELVTSNLIQLNQFESGHLIMGSNIGMPLLSKILTITLSPSNSPTVSSPKSEGKKLGVLGNSDFTKRSITDPLLKITTSVSLLREIDDKQLRAVRDENHVPPVYRRLWNRHDVIMLHPLSPQKPAEIDFSAVTKSNKGTLWISARNHPSGDYILEILKNGTSFIKKTIGEDKWIKVSVPFDHEEIILKDIANGWHCEFAFIDYSFSKP